MLDHQTQAGQAPQQLRYLLMAPDTNPLADIAITRAGMLSQIGQAAARTMRPWVKQQSGNLHTTRGKPRSRPPTAHLQLPR
jgi:hypothetical protein